MSPKTKYKSEESGRLKLIRRSLKMTQMEFADALGKTQPQINKYESGAHVIPTDVVRLLNSKFGVSYDYFYKGLGPINNAKNEISTSDQDKHDLKTENSLLELRVQKLENTVNSLLKSVNSLNALIKNEQING